MNNSVAIIGSFKQFYTQVLEVIAIFKKMSIEVTSPLGSAIIKPGIPFVRFTSDNPSQSDEMIQTITLKRIFSASATYVVCPDGYVGRTTCYEIGRIIQGFKPIYFQEIPKDIPIKIPSSHIISPEVLSQKIINNEICWPLKNIACTISREEQKLVTKNSLE